MKPCILPAALLLLTLLCLAQDAGLKSPLIFSDGSAVKTAADWSKRRQEILATWHEIMGEWPTLLEKPVISGIATTEREGITQRKVRVQLAPAQELDGYLLLPPGKGPFPAVVVPYYDAETSVGLSEKPLRDFAWQLARRGFVALAIGSPGGDARKPVLTNGAKCQPLSYLAYLSANAWTALASMPQVDSQRIGIVGHSYGGKWALFGSCLWEKYACAAWSDPGILFDESRQSINYQEPWYLGLDATTNRAPGLVRPDSPRTGAYKVLVERGHNLHELHVLMAPRPFLVSGGAEDPPKRWSDLHWALEVNRLLGYNDRVAMTNRETHEPSAASNEQIYEFLEKWLKTN
jgi:dienelactone hydrolase